MQFGVYIHFPYCLSKCPYCDFASRAEAVIPQQRYTDAVLRELGARAARFPGREAVSIYFGGGTPSLWDPPQLGRVLREIRSLWSVRADAEVTLEANPGTTDEERFAAFRELGVNRLSIGVQSFAPAQLVALGRKHSGGDAVRAFETARAAGFRNVSLDLIHGVERQTKKLAASDAASAVALGPEHISCYALTLTGLAEEVPMARALRRGELALPDDEVVSDMGDAVRAELVFFKQKTAYEITRWLEFRRVLFRSQSTFGAHFVEGAVDAFTAEVRVCRMLAVCAAGRILNPKTARRQVIGAMTMGVGAAL